MQKCGPPRETETNNTYRDFVPGGDNSTEDAANTEGTDKSDPGKTGADKSSPGKTDGDKNDPGNTGTGKDAPDGKDKSGNDKDKDKNKNKPSVAFDAGIAITCVDCYLKAGATAKMTVNGTFDLGGTLKNVTEQLGEEIKNMTETAVDSITAWTKHIADDLFAGDLHRDDFSFDNYSIDMDFDIDIPPLPEVSLLFQIDHLDLYMLIEASISAGTTINIPLFVSETPLGSSAGEDMEIGLIAAVDLILSVEGMINLRTGFHLETDGPVGFQLNLFEKDVADLIL